jgi:hypothetical protein
MFQEDGRLVLGVLVKADLSDPKDIGLAEKLRDHRDHFSRQADVLRFFGIDAKPSVVLDTELCGPLWVRTGSIAESSRSFQHFRDQNQPRTRARS